MAYHLLLPSGLLGGELGGLLSSDFSGERSGSLQTGGSSLAAFAALCFPPCHNMVQWRVIWRSARGAAASDRRYLRSVL